MSLDNIAPEVEVFRAQINSYLNEVDRLQVMKAFEFARLEHGNQRRKSGELFFTHPLSVATYLANYRLDADAVSAALLHDIAEDRGVSIEEIASLFGSDVAKLVDGVTKLKEVMAGVAHGRQLSPEELRQATLQKLLRAMTVDVRTVIIKLFDRLHNMRTIHALAAPRQQAKAQESMEVFAPIANRLGMWVVKSELEARSLEVLKPEAYRTINTELKRLTKAQKPFFNQVKSQITDCLMSSGLAPTEIKMSPENVYTVYTDLLKQGKSYRDVDRVLRVTILMNDWIDCYTALGYVHKMWRAQPDHFDDYISVQRENLYQSLHTTLVHDNGQSLKIRLRTVAMDQVAQIGVLARWYYQGTELWSRALADRLDSFFETISESMALEPQNVEISVQSAVKDVLGEQIRVFTKDGDELILAQGATPLDFAYRIHTNLGNQSTTAFINDVSRPLNTPLKNGDRVRILRNARSQPKRIWLDEDLGYITTVSARAAASRWFRRLSEDEAIRQGKGILEHELIMLGMPHMSHDSIAALFGYKVASALYSQLGRADLLPAELATRILSESWAEALCLPLDSFVRASDGTLYTITNADNHRLHLCGACDPRPHENILGYVRKDGSMTVHSDTCHTLSTNGRSDLRQRMRRLGWGEAGMREARRVSLQVDVFDRPGLLNEIAFLTQEKGVNIADICTSRPQKGKKELMIAMDLDVTSPREMVSILHQIEALVNVKGIRCVSNKNQDTVKLSPIFYKPE
ncbi:MAG TPA: HD domain-containing protein [Promineifilum sp.]